ncbi:MAG: DSD1 family PLP-dependent enzyme [Planctomycetota bacterium]|nr:MAG: DSD1 family PLP-dependent enzyme [Planctomycetota bacterium]
MLPSAVIGRSVSELDTPSLCIDLDQLEANIAAMAATHRRAEKHWRPHAKCHKSPAIAHQLIAAGARGVTVAKVSEAEVFIQAGIPDVLIANLVVGTAKLDRLAALCRSGHPIATIDHYAQAEALSAACVRWNVRCRIVLEVNIGLDRVGTRPGPDTQELARGVARLPHLDFCGIMGYEGHLLTIADPDEKREKILSAMALLGQNAEALRKAGLSVEIVSASGTGSFQISVDSPHITETQAGGGIFADPFYLERCGVTGLQPALRLLATCVSRPTLERAVLDSGRKSLHPDIHPPAIVGIVGGRSLPDATRPMLSAEHLTLDLGPEAQNLRIGDKVALIPGYCDHTNVLHSWFYGYRKNVVECVWPLTARGCLQ